MSNSTFLFAFAFGLVCLISNATASPQPLSQTILSCETLLFGMTHCYDYLEKGSRTHDLPSSSCCSVLRDAWKVDPECVNFNVLDGFILLYYVGFDRDTTRLDHLSSTCGIGSLKSNPSSRPPVASSPLEARPPVQPTKGSSASTPMALSRANSSFQNNSDFYFGYFFWFFAMWVAFLYYRSQQHQQTALRRP